MTKKSRILYFVLAGCIVLLLLAGAFFLLQPDPNEAKSIYELGVHYEKDVQDLFAALEQYRKAAKMGNADAQYAYGMAYLNHPQDAYAIENLPLLAIIVPRDEAKAEGVKWLRKAAKQGHPEAQIELAKCYASGEGVKSDLNAAYKWGKKAAESGNARAMYEFYQLPYLHVGEEWLRKAAEKGYAEAQRTLGFKYHYGSKGYPLDPVEAVKWYTLAAAQGDREAEKYLDKLKDVVSAQEDAAQGDAETQYQMALQIRDNLELGGFSHEARAKEALKRYRMAAENGHRGALLDLAEGFAFGAWFTGKDFEEAAKWYRELAELGDPMGQGMLGWLYATGRGVSEDRKTAVEWFRKGAAQGNPEAQYGMGVSIEESWLESFYLNELENWKTVVDWYVKAADGGLKHSLQRLYPDAKAPNSYRSLPFKIGCMYDARYCSIIDHPNGPFLNEPAEQYLSEAVKWYLKAAEADDLFGVFHLRDLADMRDSGEAKEALRTLAKNGHEHANAYLLDFGWAAPEDVESLLRWRAEERGNNEARYKLARLLIERNNGVTPEAMDLLLKAAKGDYNPALRELVELAENGNKEAEDAIRTVAENEPAYDWNRSREKAQKLVEDHSRSGQWRWPSDWDDPPKEEENE